MNELEVDTFLDHAKNNNLNECINILEVKNYSQYDINLLFKESIKNNISIEILYILLKKYKYSLQRYIQDINDDNSYLFIAIQKNNYKVADLLIENGGNINTIQLKYLHEMFNSKNYKYILSKGLKITSSLILYLIENKQNGFLEYLFKNYIFDNKFIINLLLLYKNGENKLSKKQFGHLITSEICKIQITDSMYKTALKYDNQEAITIIEKNNTSLLKKIQEFIKTNNYKELKRLIKNNNINILYYCNKYDINNDLLFYSLRQHASPKIIDLIIEECQYEYLNYDVCINEQILPLLFALLYRYYFKEFDYLIKKGADINHPKIHDNRDIDYRRIISILYENENYRNKTIKYIFNTQFNITIEMINKWIERNQIQLLNKIFKIHQYNNLFILNLLSIYQNKTPLSEVQFYKIMDNEKKKIIINKACYKEALEHNNYEAFNILYNFDHRDNDTILSELFSLFHFEEKINNNGKKLIFIKKINQNQLNIKGNKIFLDNLYFSEEREDQLLNYVNDNNIVELKNFLELNELSLSYYNSDDFDLLIYAIENNISFEMIKYIISQYATLNYSIYDKNDEFKSPLYSAIIDIDNKMEIFQLLIKSGADINYKINDKNIIFNIYNKNEYYNNFNDDGIKILKCLLNNGLKIDKDSIIFLNNNNNKNNNNNNKINYLKFILEYYIYENSYIINLILIGKQNIPLSDIELNQVLNNKGLKMDIEINHDWFKNAFSMNNKYLIQKYIDFGQYHYSSSFSKIEMYEILENAVENNELEFIEKFINSPFLNFNLFRLEEFLSKDYFTSYKIENRFYAVIFLIKKLLNHPLFEFNVKNFENTLSNICEMVLYPKNNEFNDSYEFLKYFIKIFLNEKKIDMRKFNFEIVFEKIIKYSKDVSFFNFSIETFLSHEAFDLNNYKLENILNSILSFRINANGEFFNLYRSIIKFLLSHKTFDYKTLDFEKILSCFSDIINNDLLIYLFIDELFKLNNFNINYYSIEDLILSCINNLNSNSYSIVYKIINKILRHNTFVVDDIKNIKSIISVSLKIKLIMPKKDGDSLNYTKISEYIIEKFINHKIFIFNSENIEKILFSISSINTITLKSSKFSLFDNLMNQIFHSKKFNINSFNLHNINSEKILLRAIHCNNIYMLKWIFQNILESLDIKLINFEKVLLLASKIEYIEAMKFLMEKLLNISTLNNINMLSLLLKIKDINTSFLTLIINILLKLKYFKLVKQLIENDLLSNIIDINCKDKNGEYPLLILSSSNFVINDSLCEINDIFEFLLNHGANMSINDNNGYSLFKISLKNSNYSIIKSLFKHGISIEKEIDNIIKYNNEYDNDMNDFIRLMKAIYYNQLNIIKSTYNHKNYLLFNSNNFTPIILSYLLNRRQIFQFLIESSTFNQIFEFDGNGYNIFHYTLFKNDMSTFYYLIERIIPFKNEIKKIERKYFDYSILDISIYNKNKKLFLFILDHCQYSYSNKFNSNCNSPLFTILKLNYFSFNEKIEWMNIFLKKDKKNINQYDNNGKTVLFYACKFKYKPLIKFLIKNGALLNESPNNSKSKSTLSHVIDLCDINIIKYLAKNYRNHFTENIIKEIIMKKNYSLIKMLFPKYLDICYNCTSVLEEVLKVNDINITKYILDCIVSFDLREINIIIKSIIYKNNFELLKLIIPERFDANIKDKYGMTPLFHAIKIGRGNMIKYLIEKGGKMKKINVYDNIYEKYTYQEVDLNIKKNDMIKYFIKNNDFCLYPKYIKTEEFIKYAIETENSHAIQFIFDQRININHTEKNMDSLLVQAIKKNNFKLVKLLINKGADINLKDGYGDIPLICAIDNIEDKNRNSSNKNTNNNNNINFSFENNNKRYTPLSYLIIKKYNNSKSVRSIIKYLIQAGSSVNVLSFDKKSLLHYAIDYNDKYLIELLINNGAILNKSNGCLNTPLAYGIQKGNKYIIKYIFNIDFNVNEVDIHDNSLLFYAIKNNDEVLVKLLVEKGADVNYENKWKNNPLIYAMKMGNIKIIKYLVHNGAVIDRNYHNFIYSPMDIIQKYKNNDKEFLEYLIDKYDDRNNSFLIIAIKSGNKEIVEYAFKKYGSRVNEEDENNQTPLDYAIENNNEKVTSFLLNNNAYKYNNKINTVSIENYNANIIEAIIKIKMTYCYYKLYKNSFNIYLNNRNLMKIKYYIDTEYLNSINVCSALSINNLDLIKYLYQKSKSSFNSNDVMQVALKTCNIAIIEFIVNSIMSESFDRDIIEYDDVISLYNNENINIYYQCKKFINQKLHIN
eukprot:jgi/Orpsp1_1/1178403/evm.model.c7180000065138.1